ncbi:transcriptional regulator, HxlR family [Sinomicrobium oceani]|uniref:Transcriptional regulator, HxlR family n=2 Tax=Sinomicrobium oceani TaxID=1150368 RepID=A0A1K1PHX8_9FLAO|nr:transcriptional regulator, HxlR family [Sinomicrobium oceani]
MPFSTRETSEKTNVKPVSVLFDLLGRSRAVDILWYLSSGTRTFRKLRDHCSPVSPTTLDKRLKELIQGCLIEKIPEGYALTTQGKDILEILKPLEPWATQWASMFEKP